MKSAKQLLLASRPFSWINTCLPFLALALDSSPRSLPAVIVGGVYFLFTYNLLLYGVNDLYDYESDRLNPRKGGVEGGLLPPQTAGRLWLVVALTNLPLLALLAWLAGPVPLLAVVITAGVALAYSMPPLRTKLIPGLDSITSSLHFVLPCLCGGLIAGLSLPDLPWRILAAFFLWGMASQALGAIQDMEFDRQAGLSSVATAMGAPRTALFSALAYLAAAILISVGGGLQLFASIVLFPYIGLSL
ncbi:MAG: prenyltransferase, partial [Candidatus Dormibacteraceae bacterium]